MKRTRLFNQIFHLKPAIVVQRPLLKKNLFLLVALLGLLSSAAGQSSTSTGNNTLTYGTSNYKMTKGIEEVFKKRENHSASQLNITDGEFYQTQVWISGNLNYIWRARKASVWLYAKMYAPGTNGLTTGRYEYRANNTKEDNPAMANTHFFKKGKLAIDLNTNNKFDKDIEYLQITGGTIDLTVSGDAYMLELNVTLANGEKVSGSFTADFDQL